MTPRQVRNMPPGDRGPALRQHALRRLGELQAIEAETARKVAWRERELARLSCLARHHRVELPADVTARLHPKEHTHG